MAGRRIVMVDLNGLVTHTVFVECLEICLFRVEDEFVDASNHQLVIDEYNTVLKLTKS